MEGWGVGFNRPSLCCKNGVVDCPKGCEKHVHIPIRIFGSVWIVLLALLNTYFKYSQISPNNYLSKLPPLSKASGYLLATKRMN